MPRGKLVGAETAMTMVLALPDMLAFRCKCQEKIAVFTLVLQAEYRCFFFSQDFTVYHKSEASWLLFFASEC